MQLLFYHILTKVIQILISLTIEGGTIQYMIMAKRALWAIGHLKTKLYKLAGPIQNTVVQLIELQGKRCGSRRRPLHIGGL